MSARRDSGAIVRVERRRHWSDEEKLAILKETTQPGAIMAVVKISEFFVIERDIKGAPPDERRRVRQQLGRPKLAVLRPLARGQEGSLRRKTCLMTLASVWVMLDCPDRGGHPGPGGRGRIEEKPVVEGPG